MSQSFKPTLGALLRDLIERLDGDVQRAYVAVGIEDFRPRYTPVVRILMEAGPSSIRALSRRAGLSHSALSQTVAQMAKAGLLSQSPGADARERIVDVSPRLRAMIPTLEHQWAATEAAAAALEVELGAPLAEILRAAVDALERRPFGDRIAAISSPIDGGAQ